MKLSMWIILEHLGKYVPEPRISSGKQNIIGVRYLEDDMELNKDYLYIGYKEQFIASGKGNVICVNSTDIITLAAPDIYVIFNEMQQMLEFYNNWETKILQCISEDSDLSRMLELTTPVLKTGVAISDISHKVLAEAHYQGIAEKHELNQGYLSRNEMMVVNNQLQKHSTVKTVYCIESRHARDMIRNIYTPDGELICWFVSLSGGEGDCIRARMQLVDQFCSYLDLWFRIHKDEAGKFNLFIDTLEMDNMDPDALDMRLEGLGWRKSNRMELILFGSPQNSSLSMNFVIRFLENNYSGIIGFRYQGNHAVIVNYDLTDAELFQRDLKSMLHDQNCYCGVSYPFYDLNNFKANYQQALLTAKIGRKEPGSINRCEDYALDYMKKNFQDSVKREMISPVLEQLRSADLENHTDYYETLKTYLLYQQNQTETAKVLNIHRNSLVYRINHITSMIDADLSDPKERLHLLLSFLAEDAM